MHCAGLIHLHGLLRLIWEERRVKLRTKDDEELWRLMFRRSGMGRLEFKQALKLGRQAFPLSLAAQGSPLPLSELAHGGDLCLTDDLSPTSRQPERCLLCVQMAKI